MEWFAATLRTYPEIAIFLALVLGYYFGKFTFRGIGLGSVTATLLAAVIIVQLGITISPHVKSTFRARRQGARPLPLELVDVEELRPYARWKGKPREDAFTLVFHGSGKAPLEQGTYTRNHSVLGRFELCLGPVVTRGSGQDYEAVVNRVRP